MKLNEILRTKLNLRERERERERERDLLKREGKEIEKEKRK
jgi:hypothetical protein